MSAITREILYRMFNNRNELLYIGITHSVDVRFKQHSRDKHWWIEVATITFEHYPDRETVAKAEIDAINAELPLYNVAGFTCEQRIALQIKQDRADRVLAARGQRLCNATGQLVVPSYELANLLCDAIGQPRKWTVDA